MRTANPNYYLDSFLSSINSTWENYQATYEALDSSTSPSSSRAQKWLCQSTAFEMSQNFETFLSQWTVAAISRHPKVFTELQEKRVTSALDLTSALPSALQARINYTLAPQKRFTLHEIEEILDAEGRNLTFPSAQAWKKFTRKNLDGTPKAHVLKLLGNPENAAFYDYLKCLRNAIAHGSAESMQRFNEACSAENMVAGGPQDSNFGLARGQNRVQSIGAYLNALTEPNRRRVGIICGRLEEISEQMRI